MEKYVYAWDFHNGVYLKNQGNIYNDDVCFYNYVTFVVNVIGETYCLGPMEKGLPKKY